MNSYSHITIGSMISYALTDTSIELIKPTFLYGCIAPDFWPSHIFLAHDNKYSFSNAYEEAKTLELVFTPAYSINAGIICHHLCDYFCGAHNSKHHKSIKHHKKYEAMLDKYVKKHEFRLYARTSCFLNEIPRCANSYEMMAEIKKMKKEYNRKKPSFKKDTSFAIRGCLLVLVNAARCANLNRYAHEVVQSAEAQADQKAVC
jgi:hypothetical protein